MAVIAMRDALNQALREEMARDQDVFIMGEDIAVFEGSYKVTLNLLKEFGPKRVIDTPIAEEGFIGAGIGAAIRVFHPKKGAHTLEDFERIIRVNAIGPGPVLASIHQAPGEFEAEAAATPLGGAVEGHVTFARRHIHAGDGHHDWITEREALACPSTHQAYTRGIEIEAIVDVITDTDETIHGRIVEFDEEPPRHEPRDTTRSPLAEHRLEDPESLDLHALALRLGRVLLAGAALRRERRGLVRVPAAIALAADPLAHAPMVVQVGIAPDG